VSFPLLTWPYPDPATFSPLQAPYMELSPAGHCPHHEVPEAVNLLINRWLQGVEAGAHAADDLMPEGSLLEVDSIVDGITKKVSISGVGTEPRGVVEVLDNLVWRIGKAFK
jgi:hypothetical protein